ncbi:MAG: hypothetical protein E6J50_06395 [Chloroflexi bacterium]|nr:MAG: hypothetical protein E6J50_06395 [Chloroflexota bacterium]
MTTNGLQKMYLPLPDRNEFGHGAIAVVDIGAPGNAMAEVPALITDIDLGTPDRATATGGNTDVVVATSTESRTVWFIDPRTDTIIDTLPLDRDLGRSHFSGNSADSADGAFVTGVAIDSSPCSASTPRCALGSRAILSVWNGFTLVDLASRTIVGSIVVPPSENFGFDGVARRIIAPFYDCGASRDARRQKLGICANYVTPDGRVITQGLNIVDLTDGTVYTLQDQTAPEPTMPLGRNPDSAAADPLLQLIVVASEEDDDVNVLNLAEATFDRATRTVTAPRKSASVTEVPRLTGVAIEQTHHYAFLEEEGNRPEDPGNGIAVLKLDDFLAGKASLVVTKMQLPGGQAWRNMGDPHGVAVSTGLDGDRPLGFLVESKRRWVARVDLQTLASGGPVGLATTFLDARTKGITSAPVVRCSSALAAP